MKSFAEQYGKFEKIDYEKEHEEEKAAIEAEKAKRKAASDKAREEYQMHRAAAMAAASGPPELSPITLQPNQAGPATMMESGSTLDPMKMTEKQRDVYLEQYSKMFNRNRPKKQDYHFPDSIEEQTVICEAANTLRLKGNEFFKSGNLTEGESFVLQPHPSPPSPPPLLPFALTLAFHASCTT